MRRAITAALALVLVGCSGSPAPGASGGPPPGSSAAGAGGSADAGPAGSPPVLDTAMRDSLIADGEAVEDATFLAATAFEVSSLGPLSTRVVGHLASGDTMAFIVTIDPKASGEPGTRSMLVTLEPDVSRIHMVFFVDASGIPADVRASVEGAALGGRQVAALGSGPLTAAVSGWGVTVDWAISKGLDHIRDTSIQAFLKEFQPAREASLMKLIKGLFYAREGLELGADLDAILKELAELRKCAENPTNKLTRDLYAQNPGEKDRVLKEIDNAATEMIVNTVFMQAGVANKFLAGFGPKWLGYAIGPGTAWSKATLKDVNAERLAQLKRAIPKCDEDCPGGFTNGTGGSSGGSGGSSGGSGGSSGSSAPPAGPTCTFPFTLVGTVDYTVTRRGVKVFEGQARSVKWEWVPDRTTPEYTLYQLKGGTLTWSYDESQASPPCAADTWTGGGSTLLVPDEPPSPGGESGPGSPDEFAEIFINWSDPARPTPWYGGTASARLHEVITLTYGCGGPEREMDADWFSMRLYNWLFIAYDPPPLVKDGVLAGTFTETVGDLSKTYDWNFRPGP